MHHPIVIVGAGFAGVALGARLKAAGIDDFVVLERGDGVGGVWRENTYPGCACDVPSALYSLSFAPNPGWSRAYATQPEILAYVREVADVHGVTPHVRSACELEDARWDERGRRWRLHTSQGELTAGVLVSAMGLFGEPQIPDIPGRATFSGPQFHSARWEHEHDLRGRRVAVIGTGASAAQFIPAIAPDVERLTVFQRTPPWIVPRMDARSSRLQRALFRAVPAAQRALRGGVFAYIESLGLVAFVDTRFRHLFEPVARLHLRRQVRDPELRAKLTPDYMLGCKRVILTDAYLPALARPNVDVVTAGVERITAGGIVDHDGVEHAADVLVWGTGFDAPTRRPHVIHDRDGRGVMERYDERPQSYLGAALSRCPNFFWLLGPFGASGNQSAIYMIEQQARYIVDAIRTMRAQGLATVEVREDVQEDFLREVEAKSDGTVWIEGGCSAYYTTPDGRNAGLWPTWSLEYARRTRRFDLERYEVTAA